MTKTILVTGGNSQLAQCIRDIENKTISDYNFLFKLSYELNILDQEELEEFFIKNKIDWCINCAAYTAVDKAESEQQRAKEVNTKGVQNLANVCNENNVTLIHISTDFVFDGLSKTPYNEQDKTNPLSVYGCTKLDGEKKIINTTKQYYIIRTSWLYSEFGNNFMKTMIRVAKDKQELNIVSDQIGTPTYARDLAKIILKIIKQEKANYGIYHYSNEGFASWHDFAATIFNESNISIKVNAINTEAFPTLAKRPKYSVLDKSKIKQELNIKIPHWKESLKEALNNYDEQ